MEICIAGFSINHSAGRALLPLRGSDNCRKKHGRSLLCERYLVGGVVSKI